MLSAIFAFWLSLRGIWWRMFELQANKSGCDWVEADKPAESRRGEWRSRGVHSNRDLSVT